MYKLTSKRRGAILAGLTGATGINIAWYHKELLTPAADQYPHLHMDLNGPRVYKQQNNCFSVIAAFP